MYDKLTNVLTWFYIGVLRLISIPILLIDYLFNKIICRFVSWFFNINKPLVKIGKILTLVSKIIGVLLVSSIILFLLWWNIMTPFIVSCINGNIIRAIIVIVVLSMPFYFILIIIASFSELENWKYGVHSYLPNVTERINKIRKRNIIIFRSTLLVLGFWFMFAARSLTILLYQDQKSELIDPYHNSEILINIDGIHLIFGVVIAVFLFALTITIVKDKPFLKASRFWNWLHDYPSNPS